MGEAGGDPAPAVSRAVSRRDLRLDHTRVRPRRPKPPAGCRVRTGYVCLRLSRWFEDVVAIDPEPDMLRVAARTARRQRVANVRFLRLRAEEVTPSLASAGYRERRIIKTCSARRRSASRAWSTS